MRINMWSGPRNLSTAMMYAFGQRADCAVVDEPFYAAYLAATGIDHPMRAEVLASQPTDPAEVVAGLEPPEGRHLYVKHMVQHMLPGLPTDWAAGDANVHLIRHPARVVASYGVKRDSVTAADLGYLRHLELVEALPGPVIDSADIRADPAAALAALCDAIGLPRDPAMLSWPEGGRPEDGVWAPHWYGAVHRSTGFAGAEGPLPALDPGGAALVEELMPAWEALSARKLRLSPG